MNEKQMTRFNVLQDGWKKCGDIAPNNICIIVIKRGQNRRFRTAL